MVRISDLDSVSAKHLLDKDCNSFKSAPWVRGGPISRRRIAIITSAGLHQRGEQIFSLRDLSYRVIPGDVNSSNLVMTQSSVNYDRTGFQEDVNVVFPIDRLRELHVAKEIGEVADFHYSVNGAGWLPNEIEKTARKLGWLLKEDNVNSVLLVPV